MIMKIILESINMGEIMTVHNMLSINIFKQVGFELKMKDIC